MTRDHLSFDELARIADGHEVSASASEHLAACVTCRDELLLLRRMDASWNGDLAMDSDSRIARPADLELNADLDDAAAEETTRQFVIGFVQQISDEDEAARALLQPLIDSESGSFARGIARRGAKYRTAGVVRVLSAAAREQLMNKPLRALALADEAIEVASTLSEQAYPPGYVDSLRGGAWKERANALRFEGRSYEEALDAIDHAERAFQKTRVPEFSIAVCEYVKATILHRMDRSEEARELAIRAGRKFLAFGEFARYAHARSIEANVLFESSAFAEAKLLFEELVATAEALGDRLTVLGFKINLGATEVELGHFQQANETLIDALREAHDLHADTLALHARWMVLRIPLRTGRAEDAITHLKQLALECDAHGSAGMATGVALDLAEAYTLTGRPADVGRVCARVIDSFVSRGQLTSAMTAFAFLREAASMGMLTVDHIRYVRKFVERLDRRPDILFVPPR